ncbi:glucose-6-phosphate dehydrogenase assembly protein OpcA [Skermania sp. ID1734]|uniref:glucose-6-phosphate dehydrogenase assembly protein OpcA n=1 Tax=Skermania sp. ID1734 TaxID=2597516 RepID=UPI0011801913|nr:glucose-6-phosphate dehydrogenase assembly protein OpcA [Skermania sp. ID1734]TSD95308.1 glucose-6-phosphate dehydrogenase assembly protein OpcA [Skermania sp. ID1734]
MIVDLPQTTTSAVGKTLIELRESNGLVTSGRVLTLVICTDNAADTEDAIDAANEASKEHPCRIIVLSRGNRSDATRLDAQIRVGGDAGASEVIVLMLAGELTEHESSVVIPFLLPDTPVVAWWPRNAPPVPAEDPVGRLAIRRITDATLADDPLQTIKTRRASYAAGDTDLSWARVTYWRALLTSALDEAPFEPVQRVVVSGLREEPALDVTAGWLASRLNCPVTRKFGDLFVELQRETSSITLSRPQTGRTATLSRTGQPDRRLALARRETRDCLAEDLRRLDPDEIYESALEGMESVQYE